MMAVEGLQIDVWFEGADSFAGVFADVGFLKEVKSIDIEANWKCKLVDVNLLLNESKISELVCRDWHLENV